MALQRIVLTITKKSAPEVKNILYKFNSVLPKINILDKISDNEIIIEFKIPREICGKVINKFVASGFLVNPIDVYTRKILFNIDKNIKNEYLTSDFDTPEKKKDSIANPSTEKEIISTAEKFLNGQTKITPSNQETVKSTFDFYINKLIEGAVTSHSKAYDNIGKLIEIASNKKLLSSSAFSISKNAGCSAINVCALDPLNVGELVNICNNRNINSTVRAKSAAKFAEIVFQDKDTYKTDLSIAAKRFNTRWLTTLLETTEKDLSVDEITNFKKLKSFIEDKMY